jgi:hypothetical protein
MTAAFSAGWTGMLQAIVTAAARWAANFHEAGRGCISSM